MNKLAGLLAVPLLVACAAGPAGFPSGEPPAGSGNLPSDSASDPASVPGSATSAPYGIPQEVWQTILTDLEERVGAPVTAVSVLTAEAETWTDGSLGCPKDGEMYTQALVDGYQVVVEVVGAEYDYRVGSGTDVRLCENPPLGG